jgi:predicted dehydrogenase
MATLRLAIVGSGAVNFGGAEGPWNHSARLEKLGGVEIVAIADPLVEKAKAVLEEKQRGPHKDLYKNCVVLASFKDIFKFEDSRKPHAVFIGVPPFVHGSLDEDMDIELQFIKAGIHVFVEKPVSVQPPEKFKAYVDQVVAEQKKHNVILSVAYMFRYHEAINKIKEIIAEHKSPIMSVNARYSCAYAELDHPFWWNSVKSGGPIVEQATHFCDLLRYFAGEISMGTVQGTCIPPSDKEGDAGCLKYVPEVVKEKELPMEVRSPRVTASTWRFEGGGVGMLTHGIYLWCKRYEASLDIWADGLRISLEEPYHPECVVRVRRGYTDKEEVFPFPDADPYLEEDRVFLEAVRTGNPGLIRSTYEDAYKTYELSWAIRRASTKEQV